MRIRIKNVLMFQDNGTFLPGRLTVENGRIVEDGPADTVYDGQGALLCPGLIDQHTHGRAGADFCAATGEQLTAMAQDFARHGVTTVLPTLASDTFEGWLSALSRIGKSGLAAYAGIHLEGRWLSPARRGAHAKNLLSAPSAAELQTLVAASPLPILKITFAPELTGGMGFLAACRERGVRISQGHTDEDYAAAVAALAAGADCFTHLYNAMPPLHHRAGGPVAAALTEKEAFAELICDGVHVAPEVVRLTYAAKGSDRLMLVSDSMAGTGCPDGTYEIAGQPAVLKDGKALTPDGKLAGSTLNLLQGVQNLTAFCGIPFGEALRCATVTPAAYLGLQGERGTLSPGARADLFLLQNENDPLPRRVMQAGKWID